MKNQFLIRVNLCPSVVEKCTTRGLAWHGQPFYSEESRLNGGTFIYLLYVLASC